MKLAFLSTLAIVAASAFASVPAMADEHQCLASQVLVFSNRVHVKCSNPVNSIAYFALPLTDATLVDRFLRIANAALLSEKKMWVGYTANDTSGTAFGCLAGDCRKLTYFGSIK
jgi:hypothetical protein